MKEILLISVLFSIPFAAMVAGYKFKAECKVSAMSAGKFTPEQIKELCK